MNTTEYSLSKIKIGSYEFLDELIYNYKKIDTKNQIIYNPTHLPVHRIQYRDYKGIITNISIFNHRN